MEYHHQDHDSLTSSNSASCFLSWFPFLPHKGDSRPSHSIYLCVFSSSCVAPEENTHPHFSDSSRYTSTAKPTTFEACSINCWSGKEHSTTSRGTSVMHLVQSLPQLPSLDDYSAQCGHQQSSSRRHLILLTTRPLLYSCSINCFSSANYYLDITPPLQPSTTSNIPQPHPTNPPTASPFNQNTPTKPPKCPSASPLPV